VDNDELIAVIKRVLVDRKDFVSEQGMRAVGPVMGVVMKEMRGRADGKVVSDILKTEIAAMLK